MKIFVDLTPMLPGGDNGGAKGMTLALLEAMFLLASKIKFFLILNDKIYDELSYLSSSNVYCLRVQDIHSKNYMVRGWMEKLTVFLKRFFGFNKKEEKECDILFCPFTAPYFKFSGAKIVSIVYDLQFRFHPSFFDPNDYLERERNISDACLHSEKIICISDYVKKTLVADPVCINPEKVKRIYIQLPDPISQKDKFISANHNHLIDKPFFLYPANFWKHKNHEILFLSYGIYKKALQDNSFKLVCTGSLNDIRFERLKQLVEKMGLSNDILFLGYLDRREFLSILSKCYAVIFPSLYEGFGMPVIEGMKFGKPILCSDSTVLPEVCGDAALFFNPHKPEEISKSLIEIQTNKSLAEDLVKKGNERVKKFSSINSMAVEYLSVFQEVYSKKR